MKLSKINLLNYVLIMLFLLAILATNASAETTFFDNPDDALIMGHSTTGGVIEETTEITTSEGGSTGITRNITISSPLKKPIANETSERGVLFDISAEINKKEVFLNEKLMSTISLINLGVPGRVDVIVYYKIINEKGDVVYKESKIVSVETQKEFLKEFDISGLSAGTYSLVAEINYEGQKEPAKAEDVFKLIDRAGITGFISFDIISKSSRNILIILLILCAAAVILLLIKPARVLHLINELKIKKLGKKVHIHWSKDDKNKNAYTRNQTHVLPAKKV